MALADDGSPVFVARAMNAFGSMFLDMHKIAAAFRGNGALSWGDHHPCLFCGTEWFFRTGYRAYLPEWIPALDGVEAKLPAGGPGRRRRLRSRRVGRGAWPPPTRTRRSAGFDFHAPSIETASPAGGRGGRGRAGHASRWRRATGYTGAVRPDLLLRLPARHGRPGRRRPARPGAPRTRRHGAAGRAVRPGRPPAQHRREPDGGPDLRRVLRDLHAQLAVAGGGAALGAQAGEARLRQVFEEAGFTHFRGRPRRR